MDEHIARYASLKKGQTPPVNNTDSSNISKHLI